MEKTLAERCYESEGIDMELFDAVNEILGCDGEKCLEEGFVWQVEDTWWDSYDNSVEVLRNPVCEWMTEEEVRKVLALGFGQIYESKGDEGRNHWVRDGNYFFGKCSHREPKDTHLIKKENEELRKQLAQYKNATN